MDFLDDDSYCLAYQYFLMQEQQLEDEENLLVTASRLLLSSPYFFISPTIQSFDRQRMLWSDYVTKLMHEKLFDRTFRMSPTAFNKLLLLLSPYIHQSKTNGFLTVIPEIVLAIGLRTLAGGSYLDIKDVYNVSVTSVYRYRNKVVDAINQCAALHLRFPTTPDEDRKQARAFEAISTDNVMKGCVGALDGCLIKTLKPNQHEVINVKKYYSGHYEDFGLNIQALVNHRCQFLFFSVAAAGSAADASAYQMTHLPTLVENLPANHYIIADAAYAVTEHLLVPFTGSQRNDHDKDSYNFFLSQLRIRVEQAFGLLTNKWRILRSHLSNTLLRNSRIITACAILHNFVIEEDWGRSDKGDGLAPQEMMDEIADIEPMPHAPNGLGHFPILQTFQRQEGSSTLRDSIVEYVHSTGLRRPAHNTDRNRERAMELLGVM